MRRRAVLALAAAATLAEVGTGARAQDAGGDAKDADFSKRLFAGDIAKQKKSYACFVRVYDGAHMAQHRLQKVIAMKLLVTAERVPEDENLNYSFRLGVKFRNRPGDFDSSGDCGHAARPRETDGKVQLGCSVDCDGGGVSVEMGKDDKSTLLRLDRVRIWKNNKPEEEDIQLSGGADDRVFRLDRVSLEMCRSLVQDRTELAAMRTKR